MSNIKDQDIEAIKNLPEDATYNDIMDIIYIQQRIALSLEQAENGEIIPNEEFVAELEVR
jgi:hypothetical protein